MVFHRMRIRSPVVSIKHIVETNGILAATTNTVQSILKESVDAYSLADSNGVPTGSRTSSFYLSVYIISEGGEVANEVPLVDWYIIHSPSGIFAATFGTGSLPTPGATGIHKNKRQIIHTEKGLSGGGNASLAGVPMIFKGVIRIPKRMQRAGEDDELLLCVRTNFAAKICTQAIYKHYT